MDPFRSFILIQYSVDVLSVSQHAQQFSQNQNSIKSQKYISNAFLDCLLSIVTMAQVFRTVSILEQL